MTLKTRGWAVELNKNQSQQETRQADKDPQMLFSSKGLALLIQRNIFLLMDNFLIILFALLARKLMIKCVDQFLNLYNYLCPAHLPMLFSLP